MGAAGPPGDASALRERDKNAPPEAHQHVGGILERKNEGASNGGGRIFEDDLEGTGSVVPSLVDYGSPNSDSDPVCSPILERDRVDVVVKVVFYLYSLFIFFHLACLFVIKFCFILCGCLMLLLLSYVVVVVVLCCCLM